MSITKTALIAGALTLAVVGTASARTDQWREGAPGYGYGTGHGNTLRGVAPGTGQVAHGPGRLYNSTQTPAGSGARMPVAPMGMDQYKLYGPGYRGPGE